ALRRVATARAHGVPGDLRTVVRRRVPGEHHGLGAHLLDARRARCLRPPEHREPHRALDLAVRVGGRVRHAVAHHIVPTKSSAGVTASAELVGTAVPLPVSTAAPTTVSGSSGNGLASLASTSTVTSSPWWASRTSSGLARASGRVEATTVTASSPGTGGFLPSVTVNGTVTRVPRGTAGWAWASTVVPCVPR